MVSERSEDTSNGARVTKSHRSDWTSCLAYLEYSGTVTMLH